MNVAVDSFVAAGLVVTWFAAAVAWIAVFVVVAWIAVFAVVAWFVAAAVA